MLFSFSGNRDNGGGGGGNYGKWQRGKGPKRRGGGERGRSQGPSTRPRVLEDDGDVMMGDMEAGPSQRL